MDAEKKIQNGFNDGYLLTMAKPDVFSLLQKGLIDNQNSYM